MQPGKTKVARTSTSEVRERIGSSSKKQGAENRAGGIRRRVLRLHRPHFLKTELAREGALRLASETRRDGQRPPIDFMAVQRRRQQMIRTAKETDEPRMNAYLSGFQEGHIRVPPRDPRLVSFSCGPSGRTAAAVSAMWAPIRKRGVLLVRRDARESWLRPVGAPFRFEDERLRALPTCKPPGRARTLGSVEEERDLTTSRIGRAFELAKLAAAVSKDLATGRATRLFTGAAPTPSAPRSSTSCSASRSPRRRSRCSRP